MDFIRIKITSVPEGDTPRRIREKWIGLELDGVVHESGIIKRPTPSNTSGFITLIDMALSALKHHNQEAFEWWSKWWTEHPKSEAFVFDSGCYTVINRQEANARFMDAFKSGGALEELVDYIMKH